MPRVLTVAYCIKPAVLRGLVTDYESGQEVHLPSLLLPKRNCCVRKGRGVWRSDGRFMTLLWIPCLYGSLDAYGCSDSEGVSPQKQASGRPSPHKSGYARLGQLTAVGRSYTILPHNPPAQSFRSGGLCFNVIVLARGTTSLGRLPVQKFYEFCGDAANYRISRDIFGDNRSGRNHRIVSDCHTL